MTRGVLLIGVVISLAWGSSAGAQVCSARAKEHPCGYCAEEAQCGVVSVWDKKSKKYKKPKNKKKLCSKKHLKICARRGDLHPPTRPVTEKQHDGKIKTHTGYVLELLSWSAGLETVYSNGSDLKVLSAGGKMIASYSGYNANGFAGRILRFFYLGNTKTVAIEATFWTIGHREEPSFKGVGVCLAPPRNASSSSELGCWLQMKEA